MPGETIEAVVLAAGRSTRMGVPKLLLPLGGKETILEHMLRRLLDTPVRRVVVVVGHRAPWIRGEIRRVLGDPVKKGRVKTVLNPDYKRGMAGSLRTGIRALESTTTAALLMAGDQPLITSDRIDSLLSRFRSRSEGTAATVASAEGELRNPAVVDRTFFEAIRHLEGDRGAQPLLRRRSEEVQRLVWGPGPWFQDVDSWPMYEQLIRETGQMPESGGEPARLDPEKRPSNWEEPVEEARSEHPAPELAPGVLMVGLGSDRLDDWEHLPLPIHFPASLPADEDLPQIKQVIAGPARSGPEYTKLLRTAAVWCLHHR